MRNVRILLGIAFIILGAIFFAPQIKDFITGVAPIVRPAPALPPGGEPLPFSLPEGFAAYLYADDLPGVRVLARGPGAPMYASLTSEGRVVALLDEDGDGKIDRIEAVLEGLRRPHGLVFGCIDIEQTVCTLYVAEEHQVSAYDFAPATRIASSPKKLAALPSGGGHNTRTLMLHPDSKRLLVSIGSSCNVCNEEDERRAAILAIDLATGETETFATGLRNTVFLTTHYVTGDIWGTDMGRDHLGDDLPPDEINIIKEGGNHGWPICYGKNVHDTVFDKNTYIRNPCMEPFETPSHIDLQAHSAPLGLAFIPEEGWPEEWWYDLLVAYHGSWNRSVPTGYKIVRFPLDAHGNPEGPAVDFMTGFMTDSGAVVGRPVDIIAEPGGTLYISDDRAGAIYRIVRTSLD